MRSALALVLLTAASLALGGCGAKKQSAEQAAKAAIPHVRKPVDETKAPAGRPKGVMLIFSGGGWIAMPRDEVAVTRHYEQRYAALGWLAIDVGYRPGGRQGFADVVRAYDKAHREHPGLPICAVGESSGGHLALMLAIARPVSCVEPVDAPTDLTKGLPRRLRFGAGVLFGKRNLRRWSPALRADEIHGRVLIVHARGDRIVPAAQAEELAHAARGSKLILLPNGPLAFEHDTHVSKSAYRAYLLSERALLRSVG